MLQAANAASSGVLTRKHERRVGNRFPIVCEVRYKTLSSKGVPESGFGQTVNISRGGLLLESETPPTPGKRVEISVSWPIRLDGKCPLQFVAQGKVVRGDSKSIAVAIEKYEFRIQASRKSGAIADLLRRA